MNTMNTKRTKKPDRGDLIHYLNFAEITQENNLKSQLKVSSSSSSLVKNSTMLSKQSSNRDNIISDKISERNIKSSHSLNDILKIKNVVKKNVVDGEKIRRKCNKDFKWDKALQVGGYSEHNNTFQLMAGEPIRFFKKDIEHEDLNERYKHFELYKSIKEKKI